MKVTRKFETSGILRTGISAIAKQHFCVMSLSLFMMIVYSTVDNRNSKR